MEKKLTAMQVMIDKMQVAYERGDKKYKPSIKHFMEEAKRLRDAEEKQQIVDAYTAGFYAGCDQPMFDNMPDDYYSTQFR